MHEDLLKNKILGFLLVICCLATASGISAHADDEVFVAHKPKVLVTPDNLPVLSWNDPGVDTELDQSELNNLDVCTPGACSQEALDAGAAYYKVFGNLIAYYDQYGRLVGTAGQPASYASGFGDLSVTAAAVSTDTAAGVPEPAMLVGATPGAFQVLPAGTSTYSIPIDIPPGTAGTQPKLALNYSSQGGNGMLGIGWSLEGLSAITRCPQTHAQDGGRTGLTFTDADRFCLDGKRLAIVPGTGPYGGSTTEYRTEIDNFSKIISYGNQGGGPKFFRVWTKSGEELDYGNTGDSNIEAEGKTVAATWALNQVTDSTGNFFRVTYFESSAGGEYRPSLIEYTGNTPAGLSPYASVAFSYEARPDPSVGYRADSRIATTVRLQSIQTRVAATPVREYKLLYEATDADKPLSRIADIQVCANETATSTMKCLPATGFGWQDYPSGFEPATGPARTAVRTVEHTMDINGDGRSDIVYRDGANPWKVLLANANGTGFSGAIDTTINTGDRETAVFDYDGDGRQELAVLPLACVPSGLPPTECPAAKVKIVRLDPEAMGTQFREVSTDINYDTRYFFTGIRAGDVDGDGRTDLMIGETFGNALVIYYNSGGAGFTRRQTQAEALWSDSRVFDYDSDGRADLLRFVDNTWRVLQSTGAGFTPINTGVAQPDLRLADVNGDGLQDAIVDAGGTWGIRLNLGASATSSVPASAPAPIPETSSMRRYWTLIQTAAKTCSLRLAVNGAPCALRRTARVLIWLPHRFPRRVTTTGRRSATLMATGFWTSRWPLIMSGSRTFTSPACRTSSPRSRPVA